VDLLDRLLEHDAWTTGQLLDRCRPLSDDQLDRPFDIGHRTVRATLQHIIFNMEAWSALMAGATTLPPRPSPDSESISSLTDRLERAAAGLAQVAQTVRARDSWDDRWLDVLDDPPKEKTYGGAIAHVITHSMHHRAQLLYMLRQLGLTGLPEGDVLSWEQQRDSASAM
jgi:uncharacterized damage-inducible protein DinB